MGWADTKRAARLRVHAQFAVSAEYTGPALGSPPVPCNVRVHTKIARYGDLDREGFAEVVEDINRVIFLQSEVTPVRKGIVTIYSGHQFAIEVIVPSDDDTVTVCEVKPLKVAP